MTRGHAGRLHAEREDDGEREAATHAERTDRRRDSEAERGVRKDPTVKPRSNRTASSRPRCAWVNTESTAVIGNAVTRPLR